MNWSSDGLRIEPAALVDGAAGVAARSCEIRLEGPVNYC